MVELIPGTALPFHVGPGGLQTEGRGEVKITPERMPHSLLESIDDPAGLSPAERAFAAAAIRAYDRAPKVVDNIFATTAKQTDATTGNLVIPLFTVPAGCEAHIPYVLADIPESATINPSAPLANAAVWTFLAAVGATSGDSAANADLYRKGLIAFAPTSAAGPVIPGVWTFNDSNAPVLQGGDQLYYIVHGGSVAAILNQHVQVTYRINLYSN